MHRFPLLRSVLLISLLTFLGPRLSAQDWAMTPMVGYQLSGAIQFQEGRLNFANGFLYGLNMSKALSSSSQVEFMYHRSETSALFESYIPGVLDTEFKLSIGYLQAGLLHETHDGATRPFLMFTGGVTHFSPKNAEVSTEWQLSVTGGGGVKIFLSEGLALRLQARAMLPLFIGSGGFFCGIGGNSVNCGASLTAASALLQGELSAGLSFYLGR